MNEPDKKRVCLETDNNAEGSGIMDLEATEFFFQGGYILKFQLSIPVDLASYVETISLIDEKSSIKVPIYRKWNTLKIAPLRELEAKIIIQNVKRSQTVLGPQRKKIKDESIKAISFIQTDLRSVLSKTTEDQIVSQLPVYSQRPLTYLPSIMGPFKLSIECAKSSDGFYCWDVKHSVMRTSPYGTEKFSPSDYNWTVEEHKTFKGFIDFIQRWDRLRLLFIARKKEDESYFKTMPMDLFKLICFIVVK